MIDTTLRRFWEMGDHEIITRSQKNLAAIMNALILCKGKLHDSFSLEARDGEWKHPTRSCAITFIISLPIGMEAKFEELTGFELKDPPKVVTN